MSRRRGTALTAAAIALLLALLAWLMADDGAVAAPERSADSAAAARRASPELPQSTETPRAIEVPVASGTEADASVPVATPRAHRVHDGLVSLEDDGHGIAGRVLDAAGQPIAGAQLLLVSETWGIDSGLSQGEEDRATSDADGRYRLSWDRRLGLEELRLYVAAAGWPPWIGRIAPVGDGPDIVLGPVQSLPLRLVFDDGGPVADALVRWEAPAWGHGGWVDLSAFTDVGRTDARGWLTMPVPVARADVSLVVQHDLHVGRHLVSLAAWRAQGASEPLTITLPRGAALELLLDDWSDAVLAATPFVSLGLDAYERQPDGTLGLAQASPFSPTAGRRGANVVHGRALAANLDAPAYRVTLWSWGNTAVLNQCWTPVPGVTTWHHSTPQPDGTWKHPLVVEFAASDGTFDEAWGGLSWHLEATRGQARTTVRVDDASRPVTLRIDGDGPLTLRLLELGEAGVRQDVPAEGAYRFVLDPAATRSATGRLRVDFSALAHPPPDRDVSLTIQPEGGEQAEAARRSDVGGIPPGNCRVWIHAAGIDDTSQPVLITAGQTAVVAAHAKTPLYGRVRGRVIVHGDDGWLRVVDVRFRNTATGEVSSGLHELGLQSFMAMLVPGHYTGEVHVGRLDRPEEIAADFDDVTMIDPRHWRHDEIIGHFEADVRLGEITDVVVDVDVPAALPPPAEVH